jgi:hypothetical protein
MTQVAVNKITVKTLYSLSTNLQDKLRLAIIKAYKEALGFEIILGTIEVEIVLGDIEIVNNKSPNPTIKENEFLKLISKDKQIIIDEVDGTKTFNNPGPRYNNHYDCSIYDLKDKTCEPTKETRIEVYEVTVNANPVGIFSSFEIDVEDLCLTQHQILEFCGKNLLWLDTHVTSINFFLLKDSDQYFVAMISAWTGLNIKVCELVNSSSQGATQRVIVPDQTGRSGKGRLCAPSTD